MDSKTLISNKSAELLQEFQVVLLYTGGDESGKPLEIHPKLKDFDLKEQCVLDYHFQTMYKNGLFDIVIVAPKKISKDIMKHPLSEEMTEKMNIRLFILKDIEDSTVQAMRIISKELTKDLIIVHGQYLIDMDLKDAIATHKIHDADATLVLKKRGELDEKLSKSCMFDQYNIYGLSESRHSSKSSLKIIRNSHEVNAMFNNFEAADSAGLTLSKSVLKKWNNNHINFRADLNDTGVYIMRNLFQEDLGPIEMIDFDLVKMMVNKPSKLIGARAEDEDTKDIDDFLKVELAHPNKTIVMACVKDDPDDIWVSMVTLNVQEDSDENGGDEPTSSTLEIVLTDSD